MKSAYHLPTNDIYELGLPSNFRTLGQNPHNPRPNSQVEIVSPPGRTHPARPAALGSARYESLSSLIGFLNSDEVFHSLRIQWRSHHADTPNPSPANASFASGELQHVRGELQVRRLSIVRSAIAHGWESQGLRRLAEDLCLTGPT